MPAEKENIFEESFPSPEEIKELSVPDLEDLAEEMRRLIIEAVNCNGGHLASNLGIVELTIALHRVFDFSRDRLIFDVGHQSYPHKILTGRAAGFRYLRNPSGVSGFPSPQESNTDVFTVGHAGTAVSTAAGLAIAAKLRGEDTKVVALVGDASMLNGMSLEAMNHAGSIGAPLLVVLNDNEMGISPTVGALAGQISRLRSDRRYISIKNEIRNLVEKVPVVGSALEKFGQTVVNAAGRVFSPGAFFELMGFHYYGTVDGHDIGMLLSQLENIRDMQAPVIMHVVTKKGYGDSAAEKNPTMYHSAKALICSEPPLPKIMPLQEIPQISINIKPGDSVVNNVSSYSGAFGKIMENLFTESDDIVAISAAMTEGTGLALLEKKYSERLFDVGIAESHAIGFAAGLAKGGFKPVIAIYSTFMQRAVDQIFHDLYLQEGLGAVLVMDRAGVVGGDGATHQGAYDIACLSAFPGVIQMAPRDTAMLDAMLRLGLEYRGVSAIRFPKDTPPVDFNGTSELILGKGEILLEGNDIALLGYGAAVEWAMDAGEILRKTGVNPTIVDLRFAWPLDKRMLGEIASSHSLLVTIEDGIIEGGLGRRIGGALAEASMLRESRIINIGIADAKLPHAGRKALLNALGLTGQGIAERVRREMK